MSSSEHERALLAIENISQALRAGTLTPGAIEGICRHAELFCAIGVGCQDGDITAYELAEVVESRVRVNAGSVAYRYMQASGAATRDWGKARYLLPLENFMTPSDVECVFRGHVRFTHEQLDQLAQIPYSEEVLKEEGRHKGFLFPGHPDINLDLLCKLFAPGIGAIASIKEDDHAAYQKMVAAAPRLGTDSLATRWYLVRLQPEGSLNIATLDDYLRTDQEMAQNFRLPLAVEFATAVLLQAKRPHQNIAREYGRTIDTNPILSYGAWCSHGYDWSLAAKAGDTYSAGKHWLVGPYWISNKKLYEGLNLCHEDPTNQELTKRSRCANIFLVRKPDR